MIRYLKVDLDPKTCNKLFDYFTLKVSVENNLNLCNIFNHLTMSNNFHFHFNANFSKAYLFKRICDQK